MFHILSALTFSILRSVSQQGNYQLPTASEAVNWAYAYAWEQTWLQADYTNSPSIRCRIPFR